MLNPHDMWKGRDHPWNLTDIMMQEQYYSFSLFKYFKLWNYADMYEQD